MAEYYTKLVCTFVSSDKLNYTLKKIHNSFNVENAKVFEFKDMSQDDKILLTYNILMPRDVDRKDFQISQRVRNTIFIHRNKTSNSLYTIDGLNEAVKIQNNGQIDVKFPLDWTKYQNQILLEKDEQLNAVPIEFVRIVNLKKLIYVQTSYTFKPQTRDTQYSSNRSIDVDRYYDDDNNNDNDNDNNNNNEIK